MLYKRFLISGDALWVYNLNKELFKSRKDGLLPLLDYIKQLQSKANPVIILDKVIGNAAALLSVKAHAIEVWTPLGSEPAVETLNRHSIKYHFDKIVPYIQNCSGSDICPMEKLSLSLENITPDHFYETLILNFPPKPA